MSRPCPLCESRETEAVRSMDYVLFADSTLPRSTRVERCLRCGFAFANSEATEQDYLDHYANQSIYAATHLRPGSGQQVSDRDRIGKATRRVSSHLGPDDLFIDIGAGGGGMLRAVREATSCGVLGFDPDPACVGLLQDQGLAAQRATLNSLPEAQRATARVVALSHVLEHLWSPLTSVCQALELLADGGVLYVETPDRSGYLHCPNVPFYYFDPEHINHFCESDFFGLAYRTRSSVISSGSDILKLDDGSDYPVCWALLGKRAASPEPAPRSVGDADIRVYVAQQAPRARALRDDAKRLLANTGREVVVWGTGSHAQRFLAEAGLAPAQILCFADSDTGKQGRLLLDRPVLAPPEALALFPHAPILVLAAAAAQAAILRALDSGWPGREVLLPGVAAEPSTRAGA